MFYFIHVIQKQSISFFHFFILLPVLLAACRPFCVYVAQRQCFALFCHRTGGCRRGNFLGNGVAEGAFADFSRMAGRGDMLKRSGGFFNIVVLSR